MQNKQSAASGERLKVLDVIRGVTMILVVFHHVRGVTFGLYGSPSPLSEFLVAFRMPMFFFISGFLAYKTIDAWTWDFFRRRLGKKAMVELVPTVVFFSLFVTLTDWKWPFPGGYWFTVSLFGMLAAYYVVSFLCRLLCPVLRMPLLVALGVGSYLLPLAVHIPENLPYFPVLKTCSFFIFFIFGIIMGGHRQKFFSFVSNGVATALLIPVGLGSLIALHRIHGLSQVATSALTFVSGIALLTLIFAVFYSRREYWQRSGRLSRTLQYVGGRTLDIYVIHWFLLPRLPMLRECLLPVNSNAVIELALIGSVSIGVVAACLAVSAILRTSPVLAHLLFGAPMPVRQSADATLSPSVPESTSEPAAVYPRRRATLLPRVRMPRLHIRQSQR